MNVIQEASPEVKESTEPQPSPEELKAKAFAENPDDFVNYKDCLVVVEGKRDESGRLTHYRMNASIFAEDEAHIAKGRANMMVDSALMSLLNAKRQSPIIKPSGPVPKQRGVFGGMFKNGRR